MYRIILVDKDDQYVISVGTVANQREAEGYAEILSATLAGLESRLRAKPLHIPDEDQV